jgi:hypothetical protein
MKTIALTITDSQKEKSPAGASKQRQNFSDSRDCNHIEALMTAVALS